MKNEKILDHFLKEYEKEEEMEPKGIGMERGNEGEEMEMGA